ASVEIAAPPEQVHAVIADASRMPQWLTMHAGWPERPPSELAEGASFNQSVTLMGIPSEVRWTVARLRADSVWLDGTGPMGVIIGTYLSLRPTTTGTEVRYDGGIEGGPVSGSTGPMVARSLADAMRESLDRLAGAVTDGPAQARPSGKPGPV